MNTVSLIKSIRHYIANDSTIRSILNVSTSNEALKRIVYFESVLTNKDDGSGDITMFSDQYITIALDEMGSTVRKVPTNTELLYITIINNYNNNGAIANNFRVRDKLKELMKDNHENINIIAKNLSPSILLKVRDVDWVGSTNYNYKTQGTERLHKIMCTLQLIVGD